MAKKRGYRVLGDRVRALREAMFLSQEELAAKAGISEATVRRIEDGRTTTSHRPTLRSIAQALEVPVADLIELQMPDPFTKRQTQGEGDLALSA